MLEKRVDEYNKYNMICEICYSNKDSLYCKECSWSKVACFVSTLRNLLNRKFQFIHKISDKLQNRRTHADRITELKSKISNSEKNIAHSNLYLDKRLIREIKRSLRYHKEIADQLLNCSIPSEPPSQNLSSKQQIIQEYRKHHLTYLATYLSNQCFRNKLLLSRLLHQ